MDTGRSFDWYNIERENYLNKRGWSSIGFDLERGMGKDMNKELRRRGKEIEQ